MKIALRSAHAATLLPMEKLATLSAQRPLQT